MSRVKTGPVIDRTYYQITLSQRFDKVIGEIEMLTRHLAEVMLDEPYGTSLDEAADDLMGDIVDLWLLSKDLKHRAEGLTP